MTGFMFQNGMFFMLGCIIGAGAALLLTGVRPWEGSGVASEETAVVVAAPSPAETLRAECRAYSFRREMSDEDVEAAKRAAGVDDAWPSARYGIWIKKGPAFSWPEVDAALGPAFEALRQATISIHPADLQAMERAAE